MHHSVLVVLTGWCTAFALTVCLLILLASKSLCVVVPKVLQFRLAVVVYLYLTNRHFPLLFPVELGSIAILLVQLEATNFS